VALHFKRGNALLLLVPKTGSTWIRAKVKELGLDVEEVGDPAMREHDLLAAFDRTRYRWVGAFVRSPLEWYRSYWSYRMEKGWRPDYPLDEHCASEDFETFVRKAVTTLPGALGNIYDSYVGKPGEEIDFVGRQENLASDFARFLSLIGEEPGAVGDGGSRVNATKIRPDFTEELKELITVSEWQTMRRFGYLDDRPDPIGLAEVQDRFPAAADDLRLLTLWTEKIHWPPDDAKKRAGRPIRQETRHARVHSNFALYAQHKQKDMDYAQQRYRQALALDPRHPRTLCNYGMFLWEQRDDPEQARQLMLQALAGRPNHPYTLRKLALLTHRHHKDDELAEVLYRQSLAANDTQQDLRVEFAGFLADRGKVQEALDFLRPDADGERAGKLTHLMLASLVLRSGGSAQEAQVYRQRALSTQSQGNGNA
jgi:Tfp pilus assembly protein PilF